MWRKRLGIVAAAVLLVAAIQLLRSVSDGSTSARASRPAGDKDDQARTDQRPVSREPQSHSLRSYGQEGNDSGNVQGPYNKDLKDPKGARRVIGFVGQNLGSPAKKLDAIRTAIVESGSCSDEVCAMTKESLNSRLAALAAQAGSVSSKSVECYQVACLVDVTTTGSKPLQVLMAQLQQSGQFDWHAPAIYSRPTISNGRQSSMWVLFNPAALRSR